MTTALLLIDVQRDMLTPPTPVPDAGPVGEEIERLLGRARAANALVVHVRNNGGEDDPDRPGSPGWELLHPTRPGEPVIDKYEQDSFAGTELADHLAADAPIVLVGMQSELCVRTTARTALRRGHPVLLVRGAHATYDEPDRSARAVAEEVERELAAEGVRVVEPAEVVFG